tara:strand:+ start:6262 stop:7386 length:1125 start_codon:yes stop_codon:yes gene_type:complete
MARLLDKKEEVIELKLTSHGKYLLGAGTFKPEYYAFLDDNIIYDAAYAGISETQSSARKRIKEDTQYLEGLVLFQDLEDYGLDDAIDEMEFKPGDVRPREEVQSTEFYRFDQILGDAFLLGESRVAPSWKVVTLQGQISSSHFMDFKNENRIPQINISSSYVLKVMDADEYNNNKVFKSQDPLDVQLVTSPLEDNKVVYLERTSPVLYFEEVNTQLLTENFDIEVFEYAEHEPKDKKLIDGEPLVIKFLKRKYYNKKEPQIIDGLMMSEKIPRHQVNPEDQTTQSVEYYFDMLKDKEVDRTVACRGATMFNKESFYVDLDFDCTHSDSTNVNVDIYGVASAGDNAASDSLSSQPGAGAGDIYGENAGVPEICQD